MIDNHDNLPNNNEHFVISYELLVLLAWLAEHESEKFKKIISKAFDAGLKQELDQVSLGALYPHEENIQQSIIHFFSLLESLLTEVSQERAEQKAKEQNLTPAIDQIDTTLCDSKTVRSSLEKATLKIDQEPKANAKELFLKEVLKNWKPSNKTIVH